VYDAISLGRPSTCSVRRQSSQTLFEESDVSPDPNDNAIWACAEQGGAAFIATLNMKDFLQKKLVAKMLSPLGPFPTTRRERPC